MKKGAPEIDWVEVKAVIERSVRGGAVSEQQQRLVEAAFRADPKRYKEAHARLKAEAIDEMRSCR